jgi:hypothetical protein
LTTSVVRLSAPTLLTPATYAVPFYPELEVLVGIETRGLTLNWAMVLLSRLGVDLASDLLDS